MKKNPHTKIFLLPSVKNYMPSSHSILTWKYCHGISQDYSFAAPQWRSPRTSPRLPRGAVAAESPVGGGGRASQRQGLIAAETTGLGRFLCQDCCFHEICSASSSWRTVTGKRCFPARPLLGPLCIALTATPRNPCPRRRKTHGPAETLWGCASPRLPKNSPETATKG